MPKFNKSKGYKMGGYSYPGKSPMKGKKADLLTAAEGRASAEEKMAEFGEMKMKSSSILKRAPLKVVGEIIDAGVKSFGEELGEQAAKAGVEAAVGLAGKGMESLVRGKKKTQKKSADHSGFAGIQFGKK